MKKQDNNKIAISDKSNCVDKDLDKCDSLIRQTFVSFSEVISFLMTKGDNSHIFIRKSDDSNEHYIIYLMQPGRKDITDYHIISDIIGVTLPEAWRPDGGVVAKFRDIRGETVFVRPVPSQSASDAIIDALRSHNLI